MPVVAIVLFVVVSAGLAGPDVGESAPFEGGIGVHVADGAPLPQRNRPPSSGPHYSGRANYGVSSDPVDPGLWIHALEHGGIAVLFKCAEQDSCDETAEEVDRLVYAPATLGKYGDRKIVGTPYEDMDTPFAAVAWGRVLPLEELDTEQILAFYNRYLDRGPEDAA